MDALLMLCLCRVASLSLAFGIMFFLIGLKISFFEICKK